MKIETTNKEDAILLEGEYEFYKNNESDIIWWIDIFDVYGIYLFTFDRKKVFNLFRDYPWVLTSEQKEIFDTENPYWADFFKNRPYNKE